MLRFSGIIVVDFSLGSGVRYLHVSCEDSVRIQVIWHLVPSANTQVDLRDGSNTNWIWEPALAIGDWQVTAHPVVHLHDSTETVPLTGTKQIRWFQRSPLR